MKDLQKELERRVKYIRELAKEIPFYVRKSKEVGVDLDEIKTPQDLLKAYEKGLYTTGEDLPQLLTPYKVFRQYFLTSGTTAKPKIVSITPDEKKRLIRQYTKAWSNFIRENEKILTYLPASPAISGVTVTESFSKLPVWIFHLPVQLARDVDTFIRYYKLFRPSSLMGLTSSIYRLPLRLREKSIEPKDLKIRTIGTGAEASTVIRRKIIGEEFEADVYDFYASSENGLIAYEDQSFSGEYQITLPETLLFITKNKEEVSSAETGEVLLTNLYEIGEKPSFLLLNYKIGDIAKCLESEGSIVTRICNIRRLGAAYLSGAKLEETQVQEVVDELRRELYGEKLTGEYFIINYYDKERRAVGEIRVEAQKRLLPEDKSTISNKIREKIYSINVPVKTLVESTKDAKLLIKVTDPGKLYKDYEKYIKPGKPKRLLVLPNG